MIGRTVSHYRVTRQIGAGGMGVVYEAVDLKLDRTVALKFLPPESTRDPAAKARFIHEARAASALDHPNVCTIHEIGETADGQLFLAMACYAGRTLTERIAQGPLPVAEALDIARQVARGLEQAHAKDIVHRDIKPANIFLTDDGLVKILDFGLAKLAGQTLLTREGTTLGTVSYMSPELARGVDTDGRTDLWGLGVVLYEMLTGRLPFPGDYAQAVIYAILHDDPDPPDRFRDDLPADVAGVVVRLLARDRQERYQDAGEVLSALGGDPGGTPSTRPTVTLRRRPGASPPRRWPWMAGVAVFALVAGFLAMRMVGSTGPPVRETGDFALAVVDFKDLDDPDNPYATAGMTELVSIGLIENCPVRVMSQEYLRDVRRRKFGSGRGAIAADQVLAVAREAGANLVLAGRTGQAGGERFVTWRLIDTETGESVEAGKLSGLKLTALADGIVNGVLPVVAAVSGRDRPQAPPMGVDRLTTESQPAYDHFVAGLLFCERNQADQARAELEQAVALDPGFALAYLELGRLHWGGLVGLRDAEKSASYLELAADRMDRLGHKDRLRLDATRFEQQRRIAQAIAAYREILDRTPDDRQTLTDLILLLYRFWDMRGAAAIADQALAYYPEDIAVFGSYRVQLQIVLGHPEEALQSAQAYARRLADSPNAWDDVSLAALASGKPDSAEAAHRRVVALDPDFGSGGRGPMCAYVAGDLDGAIALTEDFLARDDLTAAARYWRMTVSWIELGLAVLHLEGGRPDRALRIIDEARPYARVNTSGWAHARCVMLLRTGRAQEALDLARDMADRYTDARAPLYSLRVRARAALALGELAEARSAAAELHASCERYGEQPRAFAFLLEAGIALAEDDPTASLAALDRLRDHGIPYGGVFHIDYLEARAAALRAAGRTAQAAEVHRDLLRLYGGHARSHFVLGCLYDELGRPADAKAAFQVFLRLWADAEPGRPEVAEARARLAAL